MERCFYAMRLWYDGGRFHGFQRQPGLPTVQQALDAALGRALAPAGVSANIHAAARTDRGVHAASQVVSFAVRAELDTAELRRAVNGALPEGIAVLDAWRAPRGFHARASARARTYVYLYGDGVPEGLLGYAWALPDLRAFPELAVQRADPAAVRAALEQALGTHDFSGFARPGSRRDPTRTLLRVEVHSATWTSLHAVVLEGTGFLRAMVRNLVGTAVAVGLGVAPASRVAEILATPGRRYHGVRAPGGGLTLGAVAYPGAP
jgi:tRNA pseudouridine38-40 synthase